MNVSKIFSFDFQSKWWVVDVPARELPEFMKFYRKNQIESFVCDPKDASITHKEFKNQLT